MHQESLYDARSTKCKILNILDRFSKNNGMSILVKIWLIEAELFHADGQMDAQKWRNQ